MVVEANARINYTGATSIDDQWTRPDCRPAAPDDPDNEGPGMTSTNRTAYLGRLVRAAPRSPRHSPSQWADPHRARRDPRATGSGTDVRPAHRDFSQPRASAHRSGGVLIPPNAAGVATRRRSSARPSRCATRTAVAQIARGGLPPRGDTGSGRGGANTAAPARVVTFTPVPADPGCVGSRYPVDTLLFCRKWGWTWTARSTLACSSPAFRNANVDLEQTRPDTGELLRI